MPTASELKVVKLVQELLLEEADRGAVTPAVIGEKIDLVLALNPRWREDLDRAVVTDELIRRFSVWTGQDTTLRSEDGHRDWLTASRRQDWRYWQRYREWLERGLSVRAVEALDRSTDTVLALLEDPGREGPWDRRGLVVGHVQSGKTGHYSGLICKAADAGYKIVIVLAGLHNNLRAQTQIRLDEGFLGYKTTPVFGDVPPTIGAGEIDSDPAIRPNYVTNRAENGDFNTAVARNLGITPEQRPWLFVVKKNKTVLERLLRWITDHVANSHDVATGRRIVTNLPLLLIDDEADHASVDTRDIPLDEDGRPDEEHQPSIINARVRRILHAFSRSAYVGYTATPFANIFIHEQAETTQEGPDLFPAAFIVNLAASSDYVGPAKVFGVRSEAGRSGGLPLVRPIEDAGDWMPANHKSGHQPLHGGQDALPSSLGQAIDAFVLTCAIRRLRGQEREHCSMLVHVTRYTAVQRAVMTQVDTHLNHLRQRLVRRTAGHESTLTRLRVLWERDFRKTTSAMADEFADLARFRDLGWDAIEAALADAVADIKVREINGTAKDALDYAENEGTGLKVIAIGGDKLARGLTLGGLTVSYFLRASRMYDTLMQMGRWFGYRPGYIDLGRLYTTADLVAWFEHIADASEELREEFDLMAAGGATPRDYGLKVQTHPVLMVTSRVKMRHARDLALSFSGQLSETVTFHRETAILERNLVAAKRLVAALKAPEIDPRRRRGDGEQVWKGCLWSDVPADEVIGFLEAYRTHSAAQKANSILLAEFIRSLVAVGELTRWTVALIGGGAGERIALRDDVAIEMLQRSHHGEPMDHYAIGRLMSPRDEAIDLDAEAWAAALAETKRAYHADPGRRLSPTEPDAPNGPAVRKLRPRDRGVLFLYLLDPDKAGPAAGFATGAQPVVAFAVSFPSSQAGARVKYRVNNVYWTQEYGAAG